ncbi:M64 family metallopeptidase [Flavivirga aquimarina]|uniref:M64 family metallopeptidase n=1 Tax=Flavivirga aquimarina TaxID=2027862 RepID=A0ABT8WG76_9FLAO|nr:M64 family metallopeptidase [Flavivirga aquimarina]MDO5972121.1 M64 family metallopeptidase [Flavivirga aquimarina]
MRYFLIYIVVFFNINIISAQVFDMETIKYSGDNDKRINLIILSEGYQSTELTDFITDATNFSNDMFSQSPFSEYADYFNVYAIKVPSNESGADHPGTATDEDGTPVVFVDTYFNATFDAFNTHRLPYYGIDYADAAPTVSKIRSVLADNFPTYDQALILINTPTYGGSGGEFPIASTLATDIAIHELGHSLFNLKDEYPLPDIYYAEAINMTQETDPNLVKWKNWMGDNGIGIYVHGSSGVQPNWYKPQSGNKCKMEKLDTHFCSVCKEGIIEKIHDLTSPIDSYTPVSNTISSPSFPLDFNLNLIKPNPNTLESSWSLNAVNFATNVDDVSILETDLNVGSNDLTVVITDNTTLLKVTNHESIHVYTVTWTINHSSLGVEDIESNVNNLVITMYPNPANTTANFKVESNNDTRLKVDIISLDGKSVKTVPLSNYETQQVDISNLNTGIYIANVYTNNILVASKKLVKQ